MSSTCLPSLPVQTRPFPQTAFPGEKSDAPALAYLISHTSPIAFRCLSFVPACRGDISGRSLPSAPPAPASRLRVLAGAHGQVEDRLWWPHCSGCTVGIAMAPCTLRSLAPMGMGTCRIQVTDSPLSRMKPPAKPQAIRRSMVNGESPSSLPQKVTVRTGRFMQPLRPTTVTDNLNSARGLLPGRREASDAVRIGLCPTRQPDSRAPFSPPS